MKFDWWYNDIMCNVAHFRIDSRAHARTLARKHPLESNWNNVAIF